MFFCLPGVKFLTMAQADTSLWLAAYVMICGATQLICCLAFDVETGDSIELPSFTYKWTTKYQQHPTTNFHLPCNSSNKSVLSPIHIDKHIRSLKPSLHLCGTLAKLSSSCILIWTCKLHWITAKLKKHKLSKCKSVNVLAQHFFTKIWKTELNSVLQFCSFCIFTHSQYSFCLAHHPFVFDGSGSWISSIQHSVRSIANWCEGFDAYFILTIELQDNPIILISISA